MGSEGLSSGLKEFAVLRGRQRHKQRPTVYYGGALTQLGMGTGSEECGRLPGRVGFRTEQGRTNRSWVKKWVAQDVRARYKTCAEAQHQ